ncbi:DUF2254 family protein [Streptomyces sp. NPDC001922]|uniref:DUF2254 domain-containing protein n=1 Tax=Streptomyces sp. NPDC001922 TaxID=3364624 RepID=UPI00367FB9A7
MTHDVTDVAGRRRTRRLSPLREWLREAFWFAPVVGLLGAIVLALLTTAADAWLIDVLRDAGETDEIDDLLKISDDAKTLLNTVGSSMLTFIGVVFSISLVALQMANQFSPRVLRLYVRSRITRVTFAVFLATFAFTLLVQFENEGNNDPRTATSVPVVSGVVGLVLVMVSLLLFIAYVHAILRLMRVHQVIDRVARESLAALRDQPLPSDGGPPPSDADSGPLPSASGPHPGDSRPGPPGSPAQPSGPGPRPPAGSGEQGRPGYGGPDSGEVRAGLPEAGGRIVYSGPAGVLRSLNAGRLVRLARRHGVVLRLEPRIGDFIVPGTPVCTVHGGPAPTGRRVRSAFQVGVERTFHQDPGYGLRQLSDIALRALSPAVNDPSTAVQALDRIHQLLAVLVRRPLGEVHHRDREGTVRLVQPLPTWADLVDLGLVEIRHAGAAAPQVSRRLVAVLDDLVRLAPEGRREPLLRHRTLLGRAVARALPDPAEQDFSMHPDRQGIG